MSDRLTLLVHPHMNAILANVIQMFAEGLRQLGIEPVVMNAVQPGAAERAIILGANFFGEDELSSLAPNSVIFNVENVASEFMTDEYRRLLRRFHVWDYHAANAAALSASINRPIRHFKMFYVERLSRIPDVSDKDIDVLFYGSFNDRRSAVLDALGARGINVQAVFDVYGAQLDELIARAKVVINIHFYDNGYLEIIRLFDLLANRRAVVSELNPGEHTDADLAGTFVAVPHDRLVEATEALVRDPARRDEVATAGFRAFAQRTPGMILREALADSNAPVVPSNAVVGSGKMYDPKALNVDIDERWHPDIVADIMDRNLFEHEFSSSRFGALRLERNWFDTITVTDVLEHLPDLVTAMTNLLDLLVDGGTLRIGVPYDLSYGAWQDPTHVRAFNERSWLYYCEWYWYLSWTEARFEVTEQGFLFSPLGDELATRGLPQEEILRTPRAVDAMHVVLRKRRLTDDECTYGRNMRGDEDAARRQ